MKATLWIKKQWNNWQRWREADLRGWQSLGRMLRGKDWSDAKWAREIRRANRLYRLTRGHGNPWKPLMQMAPAKSPKG